MLFIANKPDRHAAVAGEFAIYFKIYDKTILLRLIVTVKLNVYVTTIRLCHKAL